MVAAIRLCWKCVSRMKKTCHSCWGLERLLFDRTVDCYYALLEQATEQVCCMVHATEVLGHERYRNERGGRLRAIAKESPPRYSMTMAICYWQV